MQGLFFFACSNKSLTRDAPTPTYISTKSEPEMLRNGTPASPATAFARRVLPVPGGPTRRTPFGILAPSSVYFSPFLRKSTSSASSAFSSSQPATSSNFLSDSSPEEFLDLILPKPSVLFVSLPIELLILRISQTNISMMITVNIKVGSILIHQEFDEPFL